MKLFNSMSATMVAVVSLLAMLVVGALVREGVRDYFARSADVEQVTGWEEFQNASPEKVLEQVARSASVQIGNTRLLVIAPKGFVLLRDGEAPGFRSRLQSATPANNVMHAIFVEEHDRIQLGQNDNIAIDRYIGVQSDQRLLGNMTIPVFEEFKKGFTSDELTAEIKRNMKIVNERLTAGGLTVDKAKVVDFFDAARDAFVITSLVEYRDGDEPSFICVNAIAARLVERNFVMICVTARFTSVSDIEWAKTTALECYAAPQ